MEDLQELYSSYSFLSDPPKSEARGVEDVGEASLPMSLNGRTYESPYEWYLVVFKPYNDKYLKDPEWFKVKAMDACRKMFRSPREVYMTREIEANKVHINAVVCTSQELLHRHEKTYCNKYKLHVSWLERRADRENALAYIQKEAYKRPFTKYLDYYNYIAP